MIKLLLFLLFLTIISTFSMWFIENDGSVVVEWLGYRVETSMAFAALSGVVAFVVLTLVFQIFLFIKNYPGKYRKQLLEKKRSDGLLALSRGFVAVASGDAKQAKSLDKKARNNLGAELPLTRLLSAQTAQLNGDDESAKKYYNAMLDDKETELIAIKGLLVEARKENDIEKAIFLAEKALKINKEASWPVSILLDLYPRVSSWDKVEQIIDVAKKKKVIDSDNAKRSHAIAKVAMSMYAVKNSNDSLALSSAVKAYKLAPNDPAIADYYANLLVSFDNNKKAIKVIEHAWKKNASSILASTYMKIYAVEPLDKQVKYAERLLKLNNKGIYGHLAVAKAAMVAELYSKVRNHLKMILAIEETKEVCNLMLELEKKEQADSDVIKKWEKRAEVAENGHAWICDKCGHVTQDWNVKCSNCGSFDSYGWEKDQGDLEIDVPSLTQEA